MVEIEQKIKEVVDYNTLVRIISSIPSCIFFKDKDLKYIFSSHYWDQLMSEDVIGKTDLEIRFDKENAEKAMEMDREIIRTKRGCSYTIKSEVIGSSSYLELIKEPVIDDKGEVIGIVGLINDVTERTVMEKRVNEMVDSLEKQCNKYRLSNENLVAAIGEAKELQNRKEELRLYINENVKKPMNELVGLLSLLEVDDSLGEEQYDTVSNAYNTSQEILDKVKTIIDILETPSLSDEGE